MRSQCGAASRSCRLGRLGSGVAVLSRRRTRGSASGAVPRGVLQ
ncbi:Hypothetical protein I596_3076 [Dokdonella koreensis DS-123]|uniref:Uncharacterized protein n=1 Tax=Dokdonella koreensis DS-123 TaxID=1300342 RepID=A0A160DWP5_9GAMM|nr:Hypothetical protein I596_3076 [Dokdonella koreensis DS-123]